MISAQPDRFYDEKRQVVGHSFLEIELCSSVMVAAVSNFTDVIKDFLCLLVALGVCFKFYFVDQVFCYLNETNLD